MMVSLLVELRRNRDEVCSESPSKSGVADLLALSRRYFNKARIDEVRQELSTRLFNLLEVLLRQIIAPAKDPD